MMFNPLTRPSITGATTTGEMGRGGRKTALFMDEFAAFEYADGYTALASTQHNTRSRLIGSTPKGNSNAFYDVIHKGQTRKLRFHWSDHPIQRLGLYTWKDGKVVTLDNEFWDKTTVSDVKNIAPEVDFKDAPDDELARPHYPFQEIVRLKPTLHEAGKRRSPYYDNECLRSISPILVKQELDIDYIGSGDAFFNGTMIDGILADEEVVYDPLHRGEVEKLEPDMTPGKFMPTPNGRLMLWFNPGADGKPPGTKARRYAASADVSTGSGASFSSLAVGDIETGQKVAAFKSNQLNSRAFADHVHSLLCWFGKPTIIWEMQGPGGDFGSRLIELGYGNLYYHTNTNGKAADKPGWPSTADGKLSLLEEYQHALGSGEFVTHDQEELEETRAYRWPEQGGAPRHCGEVETVEGSGKKHNHGDDVISGALLCKLIRRLAQRAKKDEKKEIPVSCYEQRTLLASGQVEMADSYINEY
jgi:hypothetical protein